VNPAGNTMQWWPPLVSEMEEWEAWGTTLYSHSEDVDYPDMGEEPVAAITLGSTGAVTYICIDNEVASSAHSALAVWATLSATTGADYLARVREDPSPPFANTGVISGDLGANLDDWFDLGTGRQLILTADIAVDVGYECTWWGFIAIARNDPDDLGVPLAGTIVEYPVYLEAIWGVIP